MGATKDLCRWAATPEPGLIELAVEDHGRSALMRQARAVTLPPSLSSIVRDAAANPPSRAHSIHPLVVATPTGPTRLYSSSR